MGTLTGAVVRGVGRPGPVYGGDVRRRYAPDVDRWAPLEVAGVRKLIVGSAAWLSGGVALDVWLGHKSRVHGDIDVSIRHLDWPRFAEILPSWLHPYAAQGGWLTPSEEIAGAEALENIWCLDRRSGNWCLQINLESGDEDQWIYRRFSAITLPWDKAVLNVEGMRIVAPEVQLLWKSKDPELKDEEDRKRIVPLLDARARRWLGDAIALAHPKSTWNARAQ